MFLVGLTGGIATGKTTVSAIFVEHGIPVVDADILARKVVEPGRKAWHRIKAEFGEGVFLPSGELDRTALGRVIFNNRDKRRKLNEITHPEIIREMFWATILLFFKGHQYILLDLPLLFESGAMKDYIKKIIVVTCEKDLQLQRLMDRSGMSEADAQARIEAQMPLETKCELAHFVVENSSSVADTQVQVEAIIRLLRTSRAHWKLRLVLGAFMTGMLALVTWCGIKWFGR